MARGESQNSMGCLRFGAATRAGTAVAGRP